LNKKKQRFNIAFFCQFQALEIIENEKVKISKKHLKEIIDLVRKEHIVEEIEKKEEKEAKAAAAAAAAKQDPTKNV